MRKKNTGKVRLEKQKLYPHETKKISGRLIALLVLGPKTLKKN